MTASVLSIRRRSGISRCSGRRCSCTTCSQSPNSRATIHRRRSMRLPPAGTESGRRAFAAKLEELDRVKDDDGNGFSGRLLSLVMLNVLDEKWKDHLYDLDQLRSAIHYRSWGQKDPLIEYKQEAYSMFVDLMNDIFNTFT